MQTFNPLDKMRYKYNLWVVALLEACNVTKHVYHLGRHLGFYQELEIRKKRRELAIFCARYVE